MRVLHRADRSGFKAGALAWGLAQADAEFVAVFDADFRPQPDFLRQTVPALLARPDAGMVQTRWSHLNDELLLPHPRAVAGARRPFRRRADGAQPLRPAHQLQRFGRRVAAGVHRGRRRLAGRHDDRGHGPELPRAVGRLAHPVSARRRCAGRAARADGSVQAPAGALGAGFGAVPAQAEPRPSCAATCAGTRS